MKARGLRARRLVQGRQGEVDGVRLVVDLSTSLSPEEAEMVRMAAIGFVDALVGEPIEIGVSSFATDAPAAGNVDLVRMFVTIGYLAVAGIVFYLLVDLAERLAIPWHVSRRDPDQARAQTAAG